MGGPGYRVGFSVVKFGNVLPQALGVFVQLRADHAGKRAGVFSVNVFLVSAQVVASREALHAMLALVRVLMLRPATTTELCRRFLAAP